MLKCSDFSSFEFSALMRAARPGGAGWSGCGSEVAQSIWAGHCLPRLQHRCKIIEISIICTDQVAGCWVCCGSPTLYGLNAHRKFWKLIDFYAWILLEPSGTLWKLLKANESIWQDRSADLKRCDRHTDSCIELRFAQLNM